MKAERKPFNKPAVISIMVCCKYYMTTMTYKEIADYVTFPKMRYVSIKAKKIPILLRLFQKKNGADSLQTEIDRIFTAPLILTVSGGHPSWFPGVFEKNEERFNNIGCLTFTGTETFKPASFKGQEERAAYIMEKAMKKDADKGDIPEEVPVVFISKEAVNGKDAMQLL